MSRELARRVDPGVIADHSHRVDAHADFHRVVEGEHRLHLGAQHGLRERTGTVLLGDVPQHALGISALELSGGGSDLRLKLAYHFGWRGCAWFLRRLWDRSSGSSRERG